MDGGGVEVAARNLCAFLLLVCLGAADRDEQAAGGVEVEILDVKRDELGAPQRGGEPEQQYRPVSHAGEGGDVDRLEQARERLELERLGFP
jgi:hypothetical protein